MVSNNIMLDPSLFIDRDSGRGLERRNSLDELRRNTREISFLDFYISETFETAVLNDTRDGWDSIMDFFGTHGEFPDREILRNRLQQMEYETFSLTASYDDIEGGFVEEIHELNEERYSNEYNRIISELDLNTRGNETVAQILVEETAFGLEMSPILSRLKKSFQKMSEAASSIITLSKQHASSTAEHMIGWLESELPGYRRELSPLEALEVACKYKKMDAEIAAHKLALYREALKAEIPLTNWIGAPYGLYLPYSYETSGVFTGSLATDAPALASAGFTLVLLDP
jgi:hypothetical protein